ncbi:MAG: ABC transporter permease subunit [Planctomycetota bacterium]|nr:ABC transporter permease subunit [Planctomycetota bacterium]
MIALAMLVSIGLGAQILGVRAEPPEGPLEIGSKSFTESVILGEIAAHLARSSGVEAVHEQGLGGTRVLFAALENGDIDLYPEYTGTIREEILADLGLNTDDALRAALASRGIRMSRSLGFNNTYVLGMKEGRAAELGIRTISDLRGHADLVLGFSNEFMDRGDGWPSLRSRYALPQTRVSGLDHRLAYRGINSGSIDVMDLYSTDSQIRRYGLRTLADDLGHFSDYHAVFLYRAELEVQVPEVVALITGVEGRIDADAMMAMNARTDEDKVSSSRVAADFVGETFSIRVKVERTSMWEALGRNTVDHLYLVAVSLVAAIVVAVPLGVVAAGSRKYGQGILGVTGMVQTIPSLALLIFMIPLFGIRERPAIAALFLYSLLPIVRNTYAGLHDIPLHIRESAEALGLPRLARLRLVELPMASRAILAGIKTSAVINVGTATLGGFIGAGGYGQPIFTGLRLDDMGLILQGAIPAAVLALAAQGVFEIAERFWVPKGLRLKAAD